MCLFGLFECTQKCSHETWMLRGLHHYGTQVVSGFEDGQDAFDDTNHARDECPAENQIQQAHPKTPCAEFVYAKRAKQ